MEGVRREVCEEEREMGYLDRQVGKRVLRKRYDGKCQERGV